MQYLPKKNQSYNQPKGFTLAELLISLLILGEIATFTIPKVLSAQQDGRNNAIVKEAVGTVSAAFQQHQLSGQVSSSTVMTDLWQYLNYVSTDTSTTVDSFQTGGAGPCDNLGHTCLKLHNGAIIQPSVFPFAGTNTTNAIMFLVDPDGVYSGTTNGPGKSVQFHLYYNGRITTVGTIAPGTTYANTTIVANPDLDPPWFSW
ncbi:type II secretion system protein [Vampirovibrio sp.]|uniref:type II secretion system protein n=1 Tax=Vampirovibrio sp. TaxID=2717857 RepID=UPI003593EDEB